MCSGHLLEDIKAFFGNAQQVRIHVCNIRCFFFLEGTLKYISLNSHYYSISFFLLFCTPAVYGALLCILKIHSEMDLPKFKRAIRVMVLKLKSCPPLNTMWGDLEWGKNGGLIGDMWNPKKKKSGGKQGGGRTQGGGRVVVRRNING